MKTILKWMLQDLLDHRLEVYKVPSSISGYVRCAITTNCEWYSKLCSSYCRTRKKYPKYRTIIKRQHTITALKRMIKGNHKGIYAARILEIIEKLEFSEKTIKRHKRKPVQKLTSIPD